MKSILVILNLFGCLQATSARRIPFLVVSKATLQGPTSLDTSTAFQDNFFPNPTSAAAAAVAIPVARGGGCSDTDTTLFVKVGISAILETLALLCIFYAGKEVAENTNIGTLFGLPVSQLVSIVLVVFGSSFFGSFVDGGMSVATQQAVDPNTVPGDPKWYNKLKKPSWNPPGWVFPIMWLVVSKPTQAVALVKLFQTSGDNIMWSILSVYCAHLALGDMWNKIFFGFQCTGKGAAVILVFFAFLLSSAYLFATVDPSAGKFLLPTCGWVLVATALNWNIYLNNK